MFKNLLGSVHSFSVFAAAQLPNMKRKIIIITRSKNIITQFLILFYERRYVEICTSIKIHSPAPPEVFAKFSPLTKCKHHLEKHLSSYLKSTRIEGGFHRSDNWLSCRNTSIIILFSNKILQHFA